MAHGPSRHCSIILLAITALSATANSVLQPSSSPLLSAEKQLSQLQSLFKRQPEVATPLQLTPDDSDFYAKRLAAAAEAAAASLSQPKSALGNDGKNVNANVVKNKQGDNRLMVLLTKAILGDGTVTTELTNELCSVRTSLLLIVDAINELVTKKDGEDNCTIMKLENMIKRKSEAEEIAEPPKASAVDNQDSEMLKRTIDKLIQTLPKD